MKAGLWSVKGRIQMSTLEPKLIWLEDKIINNALAGSKAFNLSRLLREGFRVPNGFVVPWFFQLGGPNNPNQENIEALREAYTGLVSEDSSALIAVRSSARVEDLPGASFAGQFSSYLGVDGFPSLLEYITKCRESANNPRLLAYLSQKNIKAEDLHVSVLVQQMISAEKSGIMFSRHPISHEDIIIIESSWGLGEKVVSGQVTPDHFEVSPNTGDIISVHVGSKKSYDMVRGNSIVQLDVPENKQEELTLNWTELAELAQIGKEIEKLFGCPQDIEWASSRDTFYILQSRPITGL